MRFDDISFILRNGLRNARAVISNNGSSAGNGFYVRQTECLFYTRIKKDIGSTVNPGKFLRSVSPSDTYHVVRQRGLLLVIKADQDDLISVVQDLRQFNKISKTFSGVPCACNA